jgi:hypothetical protein
MLPINLVSIFFFLLINEINQSYVSCPYNMQRQFWLFFSMLKACVTNPIAARRFLNAGGFTGLLLIFLHHTSAVQN